MQVANVAQASSSNLMLTIFQ